MFFLIQKDHENLSLDNIILFKLIQQEKYLHTYKMIDNKEFFYIDKNPRYFKYRDELFIISH